MTGTTLARQNEMEQKKTNQERSRKYGGSSSFVDAGQPSRAPRQDEDGGDAAAGANRHESGPADGDSPLQGISNRPAREEHAFPESAEADPETTAPDSVETDSKQVGGNRGRV
jgi:hypothetical protein